MQSVRTCYSLHILKFLKVVWFHYNVIYVTFLIKPLKIIDILLKSFIWQNFQYVFNFKITCI